MDRHSGKGNPAIGSPVTPAFLIVGVGRSGTTLLQAMLNAHPQLGVPPEIHFIRRFLFTNTLLKLGSREEQARLLQRDRFIHRLTIPQNVWDSWLQEMEVGDVRQFWFTALLGYFQQKSGKPVIGVKEPRAVEWLGPLHQLYPELKIVHIIRDPRDVFLSKLRADWSRRRFPILHIMIHQYQLNMARLAQNQGVPVLTVRYEQLLRDPETVLKSVCRFLEVEYSPRMLTYYRSADQIIHPDEAAWKQNVMQPILKDNVGKWRQGLSCVYQYLIQESLKKELKQMDIPREPIPLPFYQRLGLTSLAYLLKLGSKFMVMHQLRRWRQ